MYNNNMQGWGRPQQQQQQSGFQQPQMTGYPQQQQQQQQPGSGFMQPQATGYPGMSQFQRPMATGFPQQQQPQQQQPSFLSAQPTGMMMGMGQGMGMGTQLGGPGLSQQRFLSPGPGQQQQHQQPQRFLSPGPGGMGGGGGLQPQATGFLGGGGGGLQPQATGFMGGGGGMMQPQATGLMPQMTGMPIRDPRMQLMSAQFLPAAQPFSGGMPTAGNMNFSQASMQPSNFQSQIQNLSQQQQGSKEPRIPWALSKEEKRSYDSIFRAWNSDGSGFISGDVAREVFGQSGLEREKLMQIWHLADTENRGKLNVNEFHVAMGLIYRALNGNDVPEQLPAELVPPSARDLNDSVDFLKDLLKKDTNVRNSTGLNIPEAGSNSGATYAKARSFHDNPVAPKQDARAYRHEESDSAGYKSSSRHLDRKAVRYEGQSATEDLSEMKRQLENTQKMLDKQNHDEDEDRELKREMDDLRYRIRRVQDDIEYYNRRGGRDSADLKRKAERELIHLMHERLPQLEKRIEASDRRERDRKLDQSRDRDRRNDPYRRYDDREERDRDRDERERGGSRLGDGEYLRGTFERGRDRDEDSSRRGDYSRDRSRERYDSRSDSRDRRDDYGSRRDGRDDRKEDRDREDSRRGDAPPPPPPPAASTISAAPPPPPPVAAAPAAASTPAPASGPPKNMTPEERAAWIRSEAQRRVQERMRMLGAVAPAGPTTVDTTVEDRLKAEKAEAEARTAQADREAAAREEARKARLEEQRLQNDKASLQTVKAEINASAKSDNPPPAPVIQAAKEEVDDQEDMLRRREEVLAKEKAEREARLRRIEEQEEEARQQEAAFKERQSMFSGKSKAGAPAPPPSRKAKGGAPPPPPSRKSQTAAAEAPAPPPAPPTAPLAPPAPPAAAPQPSSGASSSSTNPFHRMQQGGSNAAASATSPATPGGTNPFYRQQNDAATPKSPASNLPTATRATPPVSAQPTGTASSASRSIHVAPKHDDDDWDESDKEDEEDDDGPGSSTRATRQNLAQALFSNLVPGGRSTPPAGSPAPPSAPPAPPAPGAPGAAPPPPAAPGVSSAAAPAFKPPSGPVDRGALLGQIQGGLRLKKAQTNDRSKVQGAGDVIGDASPPVQKYVPPPSPPAAADTEPEMPDTAAPAAATEAPPPPPPPAPPAPPAPEASMPGGFDDDFAARDPNRQSVDWTNSLAADQMNGHKTAFVPEQPALEEEEEESADELDGPEDLDRATRGPPAAAAAAPNSSADVDAVADELADFDLGNTLRVRTLYPYEAQRAEDLAFEENVVLNANRSKDVDGDWWYGTLLDGSKKGFFPRAYVADATQDAVRAKALYEYSGTSPEEASFAEGDELTVVDQGDANWWRVDVGGDRILIAPATYLEIQGPADSSIKAAPSASASSGDAAAAIMTQQAESDSESAVMVRLQSADSEARQSAKGPAGEVDEWVVVDGQAKPAHQTAREVLHAAASEPGIPSQSNSSSDNEAAMLAKAMEESRDEEIRRMDALAAEEAELQRVLQLSKRESTGLEQALRASAATEKHGGSSTEDEDDDDSDFSETGWTSSEDDDDEDDEDLKPQSNAEIRMQAAERIRVLEAAGILVMNHDEGAATSAATPQMGEGAGGSAAGAVKPARRPPPPPAAKRGKKMDELLLLESKSVQKRQPKPERPERRKPPRPRPKKSLPPVPAEGRPAASAAALEDKMEDAYDRYLKLTKEVSLRPMSPAATEVSSLGNRRMSLSKPSPPASGRPSTSSAAAPPGSPPPHTTITRPGSAHGESSKTSAFLNSIKNMSRSSRAASGMGGPPSSGLIDRIGTPISRPDSAQQQSRAVSGPIGRASPAPQEGASWSKIVGPEAIESVPEMERKRQEAIFELISTEIAHVRDLQIVVEVFFNSMQSMLSEKASTVIFANIEAVLLAAVAFLSDLEERQRESRLYIDHIGDVLTKHMPNMQVYLPYCVNQSAASEILQAERQRDTRIDIHLLNLRSSHPAARGLDLSSFLLIPMQRITRYPLLISQILRYTPETHPDSSLLLKAQKVSERLLNETNESIRQRETHATLVALSSYLWIGAEARLDLTQLTQFLGPRSIAKDGTVSKYKSGRKLRVVLFNDLVLLLDAEREALYRMPIPLDQVAASVEQRKRETVWNLRLSAGDKVRLKADSAREAASWVAKVNEAKVTYEAAKAKAGI